jgi:uncharacterized protein YprB with RNaseH-like and TPR domain
MRRYSGILSFAWKWLGSKKVKCATIQNYPEKYLLLRLKKLFDAADIVIAHNGKAFDVKKSRAFMVMKGLSPHTPFAVIDTKTEAKKWFSFDSNSLDNLADMLGVGRKLPHPGYSMWLGCERGDKKAWKLMRKYNMHDVVLLEGVFNKMKPWIIASPQLTVKQALKPYGKTLKDVL